MSTDLERAELLALAERAAEILADAKRLGARTFIESRALVSAAAATSEDNLRRVINHDLSHILAREMVEHVPIDEFVTRRDDLPYMPLGCEYRADVVLLTVAQLAELSRINSAIRRRAARQ